MSTNPTPAASHSPYLAVRPEWLARRQETAQEPLLPIVDPHHHLWERPDWRYMLDDLLADVNQGHNIVATVFVQCRAMYRSSGPEEMRPVGETEFVNGAAAMSASGHYGKARLCAGIVGHANLRLGKKVTPVLEAHLKAGGGRFRGIRHITAWDADGSLLNPGNPAPRGLMADPLWREGFACLAPLGLSFDAWLYHPQLGELADLARAFPATQIVLNHVGGPLAIGAYDGKRKEVFAQWSGAIRNLATCPNVHVKLGGIGMRINGYDFHTKADPPSSEELAAAWKPYIDTCIQAFGPARCMFESNFPVDKGSYGYGVFWNACKRLSRGLSDAERAELFSGTAARFYRLDVPV
jgi:L-fuconolactonase